MERHSRLIRPAFTRNKFAGALGKPDSVTRTDISTYSSAITSNSTLQRSHRPAIRTSASGVPTMCGPRGLPGDTNILYHNNGWYIYRCFPKSGHSETRPVWEILDHFRLVRFPTTMGGRISMSQDSEPSILFQTTTICTFTDVADGAGCAYSDGGHEQAGIGRRRRL